MASAGSGPVVRKVQADKIEIVTTRQLPPSSPTPTSSQQYAPMLLVYNKPCFVADLVPGDTVLGVKASAGSTNEISINPVSTQAYAYTRE